jgi:hypothetical protein
VVAFSASLAECSEELRSTLEDRVLLGMKLAHTLPAIARIDRLPPTAERSVNTLARTTGS